ncbi:peptide deformylase [Vagococcus sp.]|uniref:peptide deformylase n=1 Tax=Vagococcus sp. TaxID=1933889 RepID=UPI003F96BB31
MLTMKDIIREGHPTLRAVAEEVVFPLSDDMIKLGQDMHDFLKNSQDPVLAKKYELRGGVGLAAPQLNFSKRIIAVEIPNMEEENGKPLLSAVMYNPKLVSHSVQQACLEEGEGCLSVDRPVPGYVVRQARITLTYQDAQGTQHKIRLKNYAAIVVQHELDHLNGIMFYDHINDKEPFFAPDDVLLIN